LCASSIPDTSRWRPTPRKLPQQSVTSLAADFVTSRPPHDVQRPQTGRSTASVPCRRRATR
jgi:hypothetical protein